MENGQEIFEDILEEHIRINTEGSILPSETTICKRLLDRHAELVEPCVELWTKLGRNRFSLSIFVDGLLGAAAVWNPVKMAEARQMRDRLEEVNEKISEIAFEFSSLLREREHLQDHSGFASETHYHVIGVIDEAAQHNYRFRSYVREKLKAMQGQFDLKYWPSIADFVSVIATDATRSPILTHNSLTAAGTASSRSSRADFFRAWFESIKDNCDGYHLPREFKLTDGSYASFGSCALGFGPDDLVGADYVKRLRQRTREADKNSEVGGKGR